MRYRGQSGDQILPSPVILEDVQSLLRLVPCQSGRWSAGRGRTVLGHGTRRANEQGGQQYEREETNRARKASVSSPGMSARGRRDQESAVHHSQICPGSQSSTSPATNKDVGKSPGSGLLRSSQKAKVAAIVVALKKAWG
jgi:hypothetical protein